MNIQFDSASLTAKEAQALTAFLSVLQSGQAQQPTPTTLHGQLKASIEHISGPVLVEQPEEGKSSLQQLEESPGGVQPFNTGRKRRTKAEMAADAAAAAKAPTVGDQLAAAETARKLAAAQQADTIRQDVAAPVNGSTKIDDVQLRALLNGYIARHSMEEAIGKLRAFGCNRVTEALALESAKLNELAATLNG